jgi:hypothetical protein
MQVGLGRDRQLWRGSSDADVSLTFDAGMRFLGSGGLFGPTTTFSSRHICDFESVWRLIKNPWRGIQALYLPRPFVSPGELHGSAIVFRFFQAMFGCPFSRGDRLR